MTMVDFTRLLVGLGAIFVSIYGFYVARHAYTPKARPYMGHFSIWLAAMGLFYLWLLIFDPTRDASITVLFNTGWIAVLTSLYLGFRYMRRSLREREESERE